MIDEVRATDDDVAALRRALQLARIGMFTVEVASGTIHWDDVMYALHGIDRAGVEITGESSLAFVHPDDRDRMVGACATAFTDTQAEAEYRIVRPDGAIRYLHATFEAKHINDIAHCIVVGTAQDVTQQSEAIAALAKATKLATGILDTLPDSVIVVNYSGDICVANARWREFASIEERPNYFELLREILPTIDLDEQAVWDAVAQLQAGGTEPITFEYSMMVEGETRWNTAQSQPLTGSNEHFMVVFADTTDRRAQVADILHSQKLEAVGQLAAGIAHEINTPVQFIGDNLRFVGDATRSLLEVIETCEAISTKHTTELGQAALADAYGRADIDFLRDEIPLAVAQALGGVDRVAAIVRALKTFGHPGDSEHQQSADLNEIIETVLVVAQNEVKYVADVECDLRDIPQLHCFQSDLNQVFLNLIVNAAHAVADFNSTSADRGVIAISTDHDADDIVVTIRDSGGGIPESIQHRIFEPFFTTKEVGRGTGQGLAIARSIIVDRHSGQISFETEPGVGTTFRIALPIAGRNKEQQQ